LDIQYKKSKNYLHWKGQILSARIVKVVQELNMETEEAQTAYEHDETYYYSTSSGVKGAVLDLKVLEADKKLANDALNIIPAIINTMRTGFNGMINSINTAASKMH